MATERALEGSVGVPHRASVRRPNLADLEAAAALVGFGDASRVVLTGFRSWRGLLTAADDLAQRWNVEIIPTVGSGGGYVDIVVRKRS